MSYPERTLTIKRTFKAAVQKVWNYWTKAEHIIKWWGPEGMETRVELHDFKAGGQWKYIMQMPNGSDFVAEGKYQEINPPTRLLSSANFRPMTEGVTLEVVLEENGENTEFTFNVVHPTEEYCKQQQAMGFYKGWESTFDRLEEVLTD